MVINLTIEGDSDLRLFTENGKWVWVTTVDGEPAHEPLPADGGFSTPGAALNHALDYDYDYDNPVTDDGYDAKP